MERVSPLQLAIHNEAREEKYYLAEAARTKNPVVKNLLTHLAQEELEHQEWIEKRHKELVKTGTWPEHIDLEKSDAPLKSALDQLDYRDEATSNYDEDDIACLNKAIQFEMEAADFYFRLAKQSRTPQEQHFFHYLGKIEQDHMISIKDSLAYLEDPMGWYSFQTDH